MPKEATDEERPPKDTNAEGGTTDRRARRETERAYFLASGARNFADYLITPNVLQSHKEDNTPTSKKNDQREFFNASGAERSGAERSGAKRSGAKRSGENENYLFIKSKIAQHPQKLNNSITTL